MDGMQTFTVGVVVKGKQVKTLGEVRAFTKKAARHRAKKLWGNMDNFTISENNEKLERNRASA